MKAKFTPGPWEWRDTSGAGLGIYGNVSATMGKDFSQLVEIYGLGACSEPTFQIAYERWVQFPKRDWNEMQRANAQLMAAAPDLFDALWVATEHNALRFGESHNTVIQGRAALAKARGESL